MAKPGSKLGKHGGDAPAPAGEAVWKASLRTPTKGNHATKRMAVAGAIRPKSSRTRTQVELYQAGSGGTSKTADAPAMKAAPAKKAVAPKKTAPTKKSAAVKKATTAKKAAPKEKTSAKKTATKKAAPNGGTDEGAASRSDLQEEQAAGETGETPQQTMQAPLESRSQNDQIVPEQGLGTGGGGAALGAALPSSDPSDSAAGSDASESEPAEDLNDPMESVAGESVENGRATDPEPEPEVDVDRAVYLQERLVRDLDVDATVAKCFRHLNMSVFIELSEAQLKRMSKEVCKAADLEGSIEMLLRAHRKLKLQAGPVDVNGGDGSEAPATKGKYKTVAPNLRQWVRPWPIG